MADNRQVTIDPREPLRDGHDLELGRRVGAGGMGVVQEAFDPGLQRPMAVKLLHRHAAERPQARLRFIEEAQITSQLDHPNIVPVHELGRHPDHGLFFTMKMVEGDTLGDRLARAPLALRTPKELFELLQIFLKLCDAVAFAHSHGVIHRDLKPENVMVGRFGQVYLMDWGIAKVLGRCEPEVTASEAQTQTLPALTDEGVIVGTLTYMSPEQASGRLDAVDERSDIFSLGALLYEILTLEPPYPEIGATELLALVDECAIEQPATRASAALPPRLCAITMKALSQEPAERHQTVLDLKAEIELFLQSGWQYPMRRYPPGTVIVREGDSGDTAYAIMSGRCRATIGDGDDQRELRIMAPGDVFGETAVFSKRPRTATVRAVDHVTVMEIDRTAFEDDLGMGYWMGLFVRALAERFAEKEQRVLELEARGNF